MATPRMVYDVEVWRCGRWDCDTFGMSKEEANAEAAFMTARGFVVRVTERPAVEVEEA